MYKLLRYQPRLKGHFISLNKEWLTEYFVVEPHDEHTFNNIEELITDNDGEIFFIEYQSAIIGTVAMLKITPKRFELAKMAITKQFRGKGIGNLLMEACIDFARQKKIETIMLMSNRKLIPALTLYKKYGFMEVPLETTDYSRADIQMELYLE